MLVWTTVITLLIAVGPSQALSPTTQPGTPDAALAATLPTPRTPSNLTWKMALESLALALCDEDSSPAIESEKYLSLFEPDSGIRRFNHAESEDPLVLRARARGMTSLAARAYSTTPMSLASDIAADVKDADIPAAVKRRLTPADDNDAKHANAVGSKWVAAALSAKGEEPIGYVLLWRATPPVSTSASATRPASPDVSTDDASAIKPLPLFILIKGELIDGHYMIRQIAYGDPIGSGGASQ